MPNLPRTIIQDQDGVVLADNGAASQNIVIEDQSYGTASQQWVAVMSWKGDPAGGFNDQVVSFSTFRPATRYSTAGWTRRWRAARLRPSIAPAPSPGPSSPCLTFRYSSRYVPRAMTTRTSTSSKIGPVPVSTCRRGPGGTTIRRATTVGRSSRSRHQVRSFCRHRRQRCAGMPMCRNDCRTPISSCHRSARHGVKRCRRRATRRHDVVERRHRDGERNPDRQRQLAKPVLRLLGRRCLDAVLHRRPAADDRILAGDAPCEAARFVWLLPIPDSSQEHGCGWQR